MGLGKRNYAGEAAKRQAILEGRLRPRRAIAAGGSGLHQVSDVYASTQRMRRDRLPNESKGKGEHFGKTLTHSQVVYLVWEVTQRISIIVPSIVSVELLLNRGRVERRRCCRQVRNLKRSNISNHKISFIIIKNG